MPQISVIVPVYNVEQYLSRCVDSILGQTFSDFELILVDDGSSDNCGKICDEYAETDSRIHVIHQENGGLSAARNIAIDWAFANSDSKYINFIDSDDWVHSKYLELLLKAIEKYDADLSQCMMIRTDSMIEDKTVTEKMLCVTPAEQYSQFYASYACGKLYKKHLFSTLRYPVGILFEDVSIWYKLLFSLEKVAIVNEQLYYYFQREEGITNSPWTPAKLTQILAWDEQIQFARRYGNGDVLRTAIKRGCGVYKRHCEDIEISNRVSNNEKKKYRRQILTRLRKVILLNSKELKALGTYKYYFEFAYPKLNWAKWTVIGIIGKFRRRGYEKNNKENC